MSDFTEVTSESWFDRILSSIKGIVTGLILFILAFPLLWWNEGKAVDAIKALESGQSATVEVSADKINKANDKKLVYFTGKAETTETLEDKAFGVAVNAIHLNREVKVYQWVESESSSSKKKLGGGKETTTNYTYKKEWVSELVDSSQFKVKEGHVNSTSFQYSSNKSSAQVVTVGAYKLPSELIRKIRGSKKVEVDLAKLPVALKQIAQKTESGIYLGAPAKSEALTGTPVVNPNNPQVGDMKISFTAVLPAEVSICAAQINDTLQAYKGENTDTTICLLEMGVKSKDLMFANAISSAKTITWILRLVGFLMMAIGLGLIFAPLSVVADVIPFVGSIVGAGTSIMAALIAATLSLLTISIAWITYRPLIGVPLLVGAIVCIVLVIMNRKKSKAVA